MRRPAPLACLACCLAGCLGPNPLFDDDLPSTGTSTLGEGGSAGASSTSAATGDPTDESTGGVHTSAGDGTTSALVETTGAETTGGPGVTTDATTTDAMTTDATTTDATTDATTTGDPGDDDCDEDDPRLAACWGFDDAQNGVVPDGSGNGNNGDASDLELIASPWGLALRGTPTLELSVQDSPTLDAQGAQTVEMQVLLDALPDQGRMGLFENKGECSLFVDANGLDCRANSVKVTGVPIDAGVWTHVACTINDDTMQVFVNGALWGEDQGPLPDVDIAMPIAIANTAPGWNEPLLGALDRVRVWSEALSPAELCALSGAPDC